MPFKCKMGEQMTWTKINHENNKAPWGLNKEYRVKVDLNGVQTVFFAHRVDAFLIYIFESNEQHNSPVQERVLMADTKHTLVSRQGDGVSYRVTALHYR